MSEREGNDDGDGRASMRKVAQQFARTVLPAVAFDDADGLFELAVSRRDRALRTMLDRIDPRVRVPGLPRFLGRWAIAGGSWTHLPAIGPVDPGAWEAIAVALPMVGDGDGRYALIARSDRGLRYFASLPAAEADGMVLAERYTDPSHPGPTMAPTHTRHHRSLRSQALSAFLDGCADVIANSPVPPSPSPDRLPRPAHRTNVRFAHNILREIGFAGGAALDALRGPLGADHLARAWIAEESDPAMRGDSPLVAVHAVVDALGVWPLAPGEAPPVGAWELLIVRLPEPVAPGEAWFAAIAAHPRTRPKAPALVRFFTGDRTWDGADGSERGLLVEWGNPPLSVPRPRNVQPWDGPFTSDDFAEAVRDRLPVKTR